MTASLALVTLLTVVSTTDTWRVLFVANAGPVVFVEIATEPRGPEPTASVMRRADVTLVTASGQASLTRSDSVTGVAPSASGIPVGSNDVTTTIQPNGTVIVTVSSAPELADVLRAHAAAGPGPAVAHANSFRLVLQDAINDDDKSDRTVDALIATTSGVLVGRAVVGRRVIPAAGAPTLLFTAGSTSTVPADAWIAATVDGCGAVRPRALHYREADLPVQALLGPPGCARGAVVQRAEKLKLDKTGVVRTTGVALTPVAARTDP